MFFLKKYSCVLIQRGASPIGPPVFEWIICFLYRKPLVYDFDDAIWRHPQSETTFLKRLIKGTYNTKRICKWAHTVVVGNQYLASYAGQYTKKVIVIPTVVDTEKIFVSQIRPLSDICTIGWTGSHTTLQYLEALEPILNQLMESNKFHLLVIANKPPQFQKLRYQFKPWSEKTEIEELQKIDIGIMPLPDDEWTKGKCGFKAIQYMALGKPAVVSNVGVNPEIVNHEATGYVCNTPEDWLVSLSTLIGNNSLRKKIGAAAREKIVNYYSVRVAANEWCQVLSNV